VESLADLCADAKQSLTRPFKSVPVGSRILQVLPIAGGKGLSDAGFRVTFGVHRTEEEFVRTSLTLPHPFDLASSVPDEILDILGFTLIKGPLAVMRHRLDTLTKWRKWSEELRDAERLLHSRLHPDVERIAAKKNLSLLRRVAEDLGWSDSTIVDDIEGGFALVGEAKVTGIFELDPKPAAMTIAELLDHAKFVRPALWGKVSGAKAREDDQELWDITCSEAGDRGWLHGPYDWDQLQQMFGSEWVPVRDLRTLRSQVNAVNQAWSVMERISLRALDELTWACMAIMRACISKGEIFFRKSDGSTVSGPLHAYWAQDRTRCEPVVKTTDLRAAHKQFAICPRQQRVCVVTPVTLKDPADGKAKGFVCRVLPFGALASVGQFNRFSRLWQRILWELNLAASSYFDDFPAAEVRALASNHDASVKAALHLFGVDWADDKDLPFAQQADVLGVTLDASDVSRGVVRVMNKRERARDIASSIQRVLENMVALIHASRLALAQIRRLAEARHRHVLTPLEISAFENLRARMLSGRPREIPIRLGGGRTYVFTDGACDKNDNGFSCAIGGVLYRVLPSGAYERRAFGCYLDEAVVSTWAGAGKRHLIGPTELYAVVAARGVWKRFLDNERAIFFVDHSGVLSAMIKGSSRDDVWRSLLLHYEHFDAECPTIPWFARVPSKSNPGDGPSRSEWRFPVFGSFHQDDLQCFISGKALLQTGRR
ncbi:unnamed protein product, partial [Symbiodinium sp. CCMP2456]